MQHTRTEAQKELWAVYDDNARIPDPKANDGSFLARRHEARAGRLYSLRADLHTFMPEGDARVFLKDPTFRVYNADDELVPSLNEHALERVAPEKLPSNLVIADLDELTVDALVTRAAQRRGGSRFSMSTARDVLVRFLREGAGPAAQPTAQTGAGDGDGADVEDMDAEATARLLQGA
jgi:hypothetical protein